MKNIFKIVLITLLILISFSKFQQTPAYTFPANSHAGDSNFRLYTTFLSPQERKLMLITKDTTTGRFHQEVYDFMGNKLCQTNLDEDKIPRQWPSKTNGIYFDEWSQSTTTIYKADSLCSVPSTFITLSSKLKSYSIRNTTDKTIMGCLVDNRTIQEYNIQTGKLLTEFQFTSEQIAYRMQYSAYGGNFLFVETSFIAPFKVIVFNSETYQRQIEIDSNISVVRGLSDGKGYVGNLGLNYSPFYVNEKENSTMLFSSSDQYTLTYCGDLIVTAFEKTVKKVSIIDSKNGSIAQNIILDFSIYRNKTLADCNQKYLAIIDEQGGAHIFKAEGLGPDPYDDEDSFPIWVILLIIFGGLFIIVQSFKEIWILVFYFIRKQIKQDRRRRYNRFTNQKDNMTYLD